MKENISRIKFKSATDESSKRIITVHCFTKLLKI